jgi:hypothetical protein
MATTLGNIIDDIRNRADLTYSQFITDNELTSYINYSLGELQAAIVNAYGGDYYPSFFTGSVPAGDIFLQGSFPEDCYKILGIDLVLGGFQQNQQGIPERITLSPFNFNERNRATALNLQGYSTQYSTNYRYKIMGDTIMLQPPAAGQVDLVFWYVPSAPQFTIPTGTGSLDLTQSFNPITNLANWLEYVIVDVCIKCKQKEETDASLFVRQKALLTERINNEAQNRDQGSPARVSDVYAQGAVTDVGWDSPWGGTGWTY